MNKIVATNYVACEQQTHFHDQKCVCCSQATNYETLTKISVLKCLRKSLLRF